MKKIKFKKMSMWDEKICPNCNDKKSVFLFNFNSRRKDGLQDICRDCQKLARKENTRHN